MNRTIERAYDMLNIVARSKDGLSLVDIINEMNIPKSSAFDILHSLVSLRMIEPSRFNDKKYVLGINTYSLGIKYSQNKSLIDVCSKYVNELADKLKRTAFVGLLDGTDIIYIYKYMGTGAKLATCMVGTKHEAYATALGKAYMGLLDDKMQNDLINSIDFKKKTSRTIDNAITLKKELQDVRVRGYSIDNKETEELMICYGAPIFDFTNNVIATISFSDMKSPSMSDDEIGKEIRNCALKISRELGYQAQKYWLEV